MDMGKTSSMACLACITTLFLSLRFLSRHLIKQRFWWDDWLILFSLACNLSALGLNIAMLNRIRNIPATTSSNSPPASTMITPYKLLLASDMMYVSSLSLTKLSALLMQLRIFDIARHFRRWVYAIAAFLLSWWVTVFLMLLFACWPVAKRWDASIQGGHCADRSVGSIANSVETILGDVMLLILPIPQIWKLQLKRTEKVCLTVIFGLGVCVIFTSIARLVVFSRNEGSITHLSSSMVAIVGWSDVEMSTGIICACLPTLRPIIVRLSKAWSCSCLCMRRKPYRTTSSKNKNNSSTKNTSNSSGAIPSKISVCHSIDKPAAARQSSHDRLYSGADHDLYSILSMDDEISSGDMGMTMTMATMEFKHDFEPETAV